MDNKALLANTTILTSSIQSNTHNNSDDGENESDITSFPTVTEQNSVNNNNNKSCIQKCCINCKKKIKKSPKPCNLCFCLYCCCWSLLLIILPICNNCFFLNIVW